MGCMKKLGCLVVLVVLVAVCYWAYATGWIRFGRPSNAERSASTVETWQPLTKDGATRAGTALQQLSSSKGPVYVNVTPGDLAAFIFMQLTRVFPADADSIQAAAIGDRLYVRAIVSTKSLGGGATLGPLAALLGDRERVQLGGILHIIRPGIGEFQVKEAKIGNLSVPQALIPRLINRISPSMRLPEMSPDGMPLMTPTYIGDVRVSNGKITLYKSAVAAP
jgi:hypothetical protein